MKTNARCNVSMSTLERTGDVAELLDDCDAVTCHLLLFVGGSSS